MKLPPPATEFNAPAIMAAKKMRQPCRNVNSIGCDYLFRIEKGSGQNEPENLVERCIGNDNIFVAIQGKAMWRFQTHDQRGFAFCRRVDLPDNTVQRIHEN